MDIGLPISLAAEDYLGRFPETAVHMINLPRQGAVVQSGFVRAGEHLGWPAYPGGYLHWMIVDVRLYPVGWRAYHSTPFRVYICDYDDWSSEALFARIQDAEAVVSLLTSEPVTLHKLQDLGLKTS